MRKLSIVLIAWGIANAAWGQSQIDQFYGQARVPMDGKTKAPKQVMPDAFGSELFMDGRTDVALDSRSLAAQTLADEEALNEKRREIDRSIRADISSGQPVTVLIAPEHFVQLSFLKDNELVEPRRAFAGQPELLTIDKKEKSPYIYVEATAMVEGQTTNMFVETEEDGRIQTYVLNLMVTEPKNIREQVAVNLVHDKTPPMRGGEGSEAEMRKQQGYGIQNTPEGSAPNTTEKKLIGATVAGKFTETDIRKYLNTMIEMAEHYAEAKSVEKKTGRIIYRDADIRIFPAGRNTYVDPIEKTLWSVHQVWFFPKYDAILLDVRCDNPNGTRSMWDFSQMKWQANGSPTMFATSAAAPIAMQTLPRRTNRIWYLIQGNRLDPQAEFSPVFPRAERRGGAIEK